MTEGVFILHTQQLIKESVRRIQTMAQNDVAKLVSDHSGETGLVRKNVDQTAAKHDGVTDSEGFESRSHHYTAANIGIDVQIVGDFQVVDDGLANFVDFAFGSDKADALQAVDNVVFRLAIPGTLGLHGSKVVGVLGVILHRSFDQDFG